MRYRVSAARIALSLTPFLAGTAHAQFRGMLEHLTKSAVRAATDTRDRADADAQDAEGQPHRLTIDRTSDFTAGSRTLATSDFAATPKGAMPADWKTNGSGSVVAVAQLPGKWLALAPDASYKLARPPVLPDRFTVEFDLVPAADEVGDFDSVLFGFAHDNSTRAFISDAYNGGAINGVDLNFGGSTSVSSSATDYSHFDDIDLRDTANRIIHVAMAIDGDQMRVYLDGRKIADARLFNGNDARYFFLSSPLNYRHGATMLFGNFRIAAN